ncbi:hypothetical protein AWN90_36070 [Nocardia terpenica]|uniref:Uncharacterized protein n=1 Tax=Nocardia terpenica TaxID=455432 RepID=A0A161Z1Z9_9NOCA|nr:hypothetical protein AWN90_36070 [Nocardia terpenica]
MPYQLVRPTAREQVDPNSSVEPAQHSSRSNADSDDSDTSRGLREATASTIRPFCRTFVRYPNSRTILRINIPDVDAEHYQYAFKRLESDKIVQYPHLRIFYAQVAWSTDPVFTETTAEVSLYAGERDCEARARVVRSYRVVIDWSQWDPKLRAALRLEIRVAQQEAREQVGTTAKSWLFFLGKQDPVEPATFRVGHHADYAFLTAQIRYPASQSPKPPTPRRPGTSRRYLRNNPTRRRK